MRIAAVTLAMTVAIAVATLLGVTSATAQDFDEDDSYDQAFPADPGGPIADPPIGGPAVTGEAAGVGDMPVGGPSVTGEAVGVGDRAVGGPMVTGAPVGMDDGPVGGPAVGGGPVGDAPVEGEPLY